jgi:hypothetical protein
MAVESLILKREGGMKINLTKKEYRLLLDILEIADWVMDSYHVDPPEETRPYRELAQKFFAQAAEYGCENLIEYDPAIDAHYPSDELDFDGDWRMLMHAFVDYTFWDELIDRLAERDVLNEIGVSRYEKMDPFELSEKIDQAAEKYADEFDENGIDNIRFAGLPWAQLKKKGD